MNKKLLAYILGSLILILFIGIIIPKVAIKNPNLSSSPCAERAVKAESKFPAWLIRTPKVKSFSISQVDMTFYTLFGIKTNKGKYVSCLLLANSSTHSWVRYQNEKLGFSLEYPADELKPQEGGADEPDVVSFNTKDSYDSIQVNVQQTSVSDIESYYSQLPGFKNNNTYTPTTIAGIEAYDSQGIGSPCPECRTFTLVYQNKLYALNIDLPPADTEHVRQSFQLIPNSFGQFNSLGRIAFTNTSSQWQNYSSDIYPMSFDVPAGAMVTISNSGTQGQFTNILGLLVNDTNWPWIVITYFPNGPLWNPPAGTNLDDWILHNKDYPIAYDGQGKDITISGLQAVHLIDNPSEQARGMESFYVIYQNRLYNILFLNSTGKPSDWTVYDRFLQSIKF